MSRICVKWEAYGRYLTRDLFLLSWLVPLAALSAIPPLLSFYSKDVIIEADTFISTVPGASYAYFCVQAGVGITALYTFELSF